MYSSIDDFGGGGDNRMSVFRESFWVSAKFTPWTRNISFNSGHCVIELEALYHVMHVYLVFSDSQAIIFYLYAMMEVSLE